MAASKRLESLPTELVEIIAKYLEAKDLSSFRLSSQQLQKRSRNAWSNRYLKRLIIRATPFEVDAVLKMMQNEEIASKVKGCLLTGDRCFSDRSPLHVNESTISRLPLDLSMVEHIMSQLDRILALLPDITSIELISVQMDGLMSGRRKLPAVRVSTLTQLSKLKTIKIVDCKLVQSDLIHVLTAVKHTTAELSFRGVKLKGDWREIFQFVRDDMRLNRLRIDELYHSLREPRSCPENNLLPKGIGGIDKAFKLPGQGIQCYTIRYTASAMYGGEGVKKGINQILEIAPSPMGDA